MDIASALRQLDPSDDSLWTDDGVPRVNAVAEIYGSALTRQQIRDAAPDFNRELAAKAWAEAEEDPTPLADAEDPQGAPPAAGDDDVPGTIEAFDPDAAALMVPVVDDEVLGMRAGDVYADEHLIDRAIVEFSRQNDALARRRDLINERLTEVGKRVELLERAKINLQRMQKNRSSKSAPLRAYLEQQQKSREERAARARRFIEAGTTAEDVREQLRTKSKLDSAMSQRKQSRGGGRPVYPTRSSEG